MAKRGETGANPTHILQQIAEDNLLAFSLFFEQQYDKVFKYARFFIQSEETCNEIASDIFYNVWNNRRNLPLIENLNNYLCVSVRNQALKYKKHSSRFANDPIEDMPNNIHIDIHTPEQSLINDELKTIIANAVNDLPDRCKMVFLMVREEGLKYKEVAELLSISERTVQGQMVIAVKKIITSIQKYFPNFSHGQALLLFIHNVRQNKPNK